MRHRPIIIAAILAAAPSLSAQSVPFYGPEIRPFIGAFMPEGAFEYQFKSATTLGVEGAFELSPNFHVLATLSWTPVHHTFAAIANDQTSVWQYDLGAELNLVRKMGEHALFRPFAGVGAGARTYDYRQPGVATSTCSAVYGAAGTELQRGTLAWRFEGRGYLMCFANPVSGKKNIRNDYSLMFGAAWHFR